MLNNDRWAGREKWAQRVSLPVEAAVKYAQGESVRFECAVADALRGNDSVHWRLQVGQVSGRAPSWLGALSRCPHYLQVSSTLLLLAIPLGTWSGARPMALGTVLNFSPPLPLPPVPRQSAQIPLVLRCIGAMGLE